MSKKVFYLLDALLLLEEMNHDLEFSISVNDADNLVSDNS